MLALLSFAIATVLFALNALTWHTTDVNWPLGFVALGLVLDHLGAFVSITRRPSA